MPKPFENKEICVIFNPVARGEKAREFITQLRGLTQGCALKATEAQGHARKLAKEALKEGYKTIVSAGGDGTLNEVVNGICDFEGGLQNAILGVIPLGTTNVFARELQIPRDPFRAWEIILRGKIMTIDLPYAEFGDNATFQRRYFVQIGGAGLDARAIELLNFSLKKKIGWLSYIWAGLKALKEEQPQINLNSEDINIKANLVLIGNGRFFGGNFLLFPGAKLCDGFMDVTVFPEVNYLTAMRCMPGFLTEDFSKRAGAIHYKFKSFSLRSNKRTPFQLEGEYAGLLPAQFALLPSALNVIVP